VCSLVQRSWTPRILCLAEAPRGPPSRRSGTDVAPIDHFPGLHVRPATGWVNDPNGLGFWDGRWHVMFQWNPSGPVHDAIHWGHMSSPDLLHWRDEGVALRPRPGAIDQAGVWSGVATIDDGGRPALVYSALSEDPDTAVVAIARQSAGGGWEQQDVVVLPAPPDDTVHDVRDPYVVQIDGHRYGIQGAGTVRGDGAVLLYDASDLECWTPLGMLLSRSDVPGPLDARGSIWECPQLVPIEDEWLLVVSWFEGGTGAQGVSGFVGRLEPQPSGIRFVPRNGSALDHGPDFYAPQLLRHGDRILAWAWSWEGRGRGTNHRDPAATTAAGWAGTLTFPREVVLHHEVVMCRPAPELDALRREPLGHATPGTAFTTQESAWTAEIPGPATLSLAGGDTDRTAWTGSPALPGRPIRAYVDGSIIEIFDPAHGSSTLRAYARPVERWALHTHSDQHIVVHRLGLP
jgi:beta-fructofuranosidase